MDFRCENIISEYTDEPVKEIRKLEGGHINSSFLVLTNERYVLQKLNRNLFSENKDLIEHNYLKYRNACRSYSDKEEWYCPMWLYDRDKRFLHSDDDGNVWRMYAYIRSDDPYGEKKPDPFEAGRGLGRIHMILGSIRDIKTIETTLHLHDLLYHYEKYLKQDTVDTKRDKELDRMIKDNIEDMLSFSPPKEGIIHGDAKISNMIIDNGRVMGFIDLDTIMKGSYYDDISDCARSCCLNEHGSFSDDKVTDLISGYEEGTGREFTTEQVRMLKKNMVKNRFMLGLRYYTDHLSEEGYFREKYKGQRLDRARELIGR